MNEETNDEKVDRVTGKATCLGFLMMRNMGNIPPEDREVVEYFFDWLKTKQATAIFALVSLISGFFFLNQNITGNVILNENYSLNILPIIGLFLILCSVVLGAYSVRKKN